MCLDIILKGNGYMTDNQLTKIEIDNYKAFNGFIMRLCPQEGLNLNLLIGRNGSGKSSFLDALAEIGCNNLTSAPDKSVDNTRFKYTLTLNKKDKVNQIERNETGLWDKVVRFYTGYTERAFEEENQNIISGNSETFRKALWVYLSGGFDTQDDNWHKLINLIFNNNFINKPTDTLKIKALWIDTINIITKVSLDNGETEVDDFIKNNFENEPDVCLPMASEEGKDVRRSFWTMRSNGILAKGVRDNPYIFLEQFCNAFKQNKIDKCGFLYELNGKNETFEEQFLSDGENGFMSRYALLYLISKTTNEKFLILLDEPETHFNEHWKRYFLKLLCDVLAQKNADVFVATHSAMLVSDVKKHELHRFELNDNEIVSNDCLLNSYGANIIDIGQILFKMEGNIGERAKDEIEKLLNSNYKKDIEKIESLLSEVGPGEYRWRLRAKLQELMSQKKITVPVCPLVRKRRKHA